MAIGLCYRRAMGLWIFEGARVTTWRAASLACLVVALGCEGSSANPGAETSPGSGAADAGESGASSFDTNASSLIERSGTDTETDHSRQTNGASATSETHSTGDTVPNNDSTLSANSSERTTSDEATNDASASPSTSACTSDTSGSNPSDDEATTSSATTTEETATSVDTASIATSDSTPPTGAELYVINSCNACHGDQGQGTVLGPEIQHPMADHFEEIVANGTGTHVLDTYQGQSAMIAYGNILSKPERDSIRDWLAAFPQPTTGAALFADYCAHCHGDDARGGAKVSDGPPIVVEAYATAYHSAPFINLDRNGEIAYVRAGHTQENSTPIEPAERRGYMPAFPSSVISDQELTLILDWVPQN